MRIDFEALGARKKELEATYDHKLMPGGITMARMDGRSFHKLLKKAEKPYDIAYITAMEATAVALIKEFACDLVYTQSDEITLFWKELNLFDLRIQKLCSVLASFTAVHFSQRWDAKGITPSFDCRVWQEPTFKDAAENFLWREWDAAKNSVSMAAHTMFKQKELHRTDTKERIAMMEGRGFHWNLLDDRLERGSFFKKTTTFRPITEAELLQVPVNHRHLHSKQVERSLIDRKKWPRLTTIANLTDIFFNEDFLSVEEDVEDAQGSK